MRKMTFAAVVLVALVATSYAVAHGIEGAKSAKSVAATFTATGSTTSTRTCTTTDGKTIVITDGKYTGAAAGDPDLTGAITVRARSVINTTDNVGTVDGRLAIDASGKYLYVANSGAGTIGGDTFGTIGQPVASTVAKSVQAGTGTNCVTTVGAPSPSDQSHATYLYASNGLGNSVTGEQMNPQDGSLKAIQGSPFGGSTLPSCIVSAPHFPR